MEYNKQNIVKIVKAMEADWMELNGMENKLGINDDESKTAISLCEKFVGLLTNEEFFNKMCQIHNVE